MTQETEIKPETIRQVFERFLGENAEVRVIFRRNDAGNVIPTRVPDDHVVVFTYGLSMPRPITDLEVTDEAIEATLSFGSEYLKTRVTLASIVYLSVPTVTYGFSDGKVSQLFNRPEVATSPVVRKKPHLKLV